jgi:hypothetical protein
MKKTIIIYISLTVCVFALPSCSKKKGCTDPISIKYDKDAEEDDGTCVYAGTGGNTTIVALPQHHGTAIIGKIGYVDSAFVKFNTQESPGNNAAAYDLVIAGEEGENHVHIEGMKPGKYYIMMTGFDSTITQRVAGGIPYTLTQESGEVDVVVPVTED